MKKSLLQKEAIFETIAAGIAGHALQNIMAEKQLLNEKGGREFVKQLLGANKGKFIDGFGNALIPEKGILLDEAREAVKELPNLDIKSKALLHRISTGNFDKRTIEKALQNKALHKILGHNLNTLLTKMKELPDEAIKDLKAVHKNNGIGRFAQGAAKELRHIDNETLKKALTNKTPKESIAGEIFGNAVIGKIEPGVAMLNATKRLMGAHIPKPKNKALQTLWKTHKTAQDYINERFVKKPLTQAYEYGKQGKEIGALYGYGDTPMEKIMSGKIMDRYLFNRPLSELNSYANKVGLLAHKYGK